MHLSRNKEKYILYVLGIRFRQQPKNKEPYTSFNLNKIRNDSGSLHRKKRDGAYEEK